MQVQADRIRLKRNGTRGIFAFVQALVPGILLCLSASSVAAQAKPKNVLVLSAGRGHLSIDQMEASLRAHVPWPVNFSSTDLENPRFDDESYRRILAEELRHGYAAETPDLVVTVMDPLLEFAVEFHDKIFPGVPIVFMSVSSPEAKRRMWHWPGVTGVASPVGIRETIDLALRIHPDTTAIAVITNVSGTEKEYFAAVHAELLRYQDKVKEIDIIGPAGGELLEKVAALPPHTVILFQLWPVDKYSSAFGVDDVLSAVAQRLPTYCIFPGLCLNHGGIGGVYDDPKNDAVLAGVVAARVLTGEPPEKIPVAQNSKLHVEVDWRALQRWHIPESALPAGSVILYQPPSFWDQYRRYVITAAIVIAVLLLLIMGLLWERGRKRKAETRLRESEKRFRVMADTTPSLVWMCDPEGKITYLNERRIAFTGRDPNAEFSDLWTTYIHPDDRKNVLDVFSHGLENRQPFTNEYRLRRSDGVYRWMFDVASPRLNGDGSFAGFIGSGVDVTDQKLAQQALEKVSGQLIEAQENERRRIARDLHDDICQRLALLSMELDQANRSANESANVTKQRISEIRQHCAEISGDVQSLSHELHSSRLDYLGIVAAVGGFCHEFSRQHEVSIQFRDENVPADLPRDISLCLFRVTQEALHNAVKYSGVSQYAVELTATREEIQLVVSDSGAGFDVEGTQGSRGLGLVSMQERVHLVQGRLHVESEPGKGTKILAVVPLTNGKEGYSEGRGTEESQDMVGKA